MADYLQARDEWERESCLSAALRDVASSPGWVATMLLLGLASCVPVLGFVVTGFGLNWARELSFDRREPLPQRIFADGAFMRGLLANVAMFLLSIPLIVAGVLVIFALSGIGALVLIPVTAAYLALVQACLVRMAVRDSFGAAFDVPVVWRARKMAPGLFSSALVPPIVASIASSFAVGVVTAVVQPELLANLAFLDYGQLSFDVWLMLLNGSANLALTAASVLGSVASAAATVVSLRALGHWSRRAAPEWAEEACGESR